MGPDGTITVSPQEGEWTPASQISEAKPGGYYGYPGPRESDARLVRADVEIGILDGARVQVLSGIAEGTEVLLK